MNFWKPRRKEELRRHLAKIVSRRNGGKEGARSS